MEQLLLTSLPESVVDDLGFYGDPYFNSFESTRYDLDFRSFSSGSNSPFAPKERPIVVPQPMAGVHLSPWVNIKSKTNSLCDPDACSLSSPMSNLKVMSFDKTYSSGEHYGVNCGELRLEMEEICEEEMRFSSIYSKSKKRNFGGMSGTPLRVPDHVLSLRNRREKLSRLFVELSAAIPGLKKLDKASVLEDAIKHIKELKDRVKALEEGHTMNYMVSSKRSRLESYDGNLDCSMPPFDGCNRPLPEVTARVSHEHVLLKIHCEKHQSRIVPIFNEIEKLNLTILSHGILLFGNSIVDITVIAEMDVDFSLTIDDLARNLCRALINFA